MIIALAVAVLFAAVLAVVNVRLRRRLDDFVEVDRERAEQLASVRTDLAAARTAVSETESARDEAVTRAARSRRDAADVANRLAEESSARQRAMHDLAEATAAIGDLQHRLDEVAAAAVAAPPVDGPSPEGSRPEGTPPDGSLDDWAPMAWALTLARIDRLWHVAVVAGSDQVSPLLDSEHRFTTAVEILVAAAREEAGALIDLDAEADGNPSPALSISAFALVEELVASATHQSGSAQMTVSATDHAVDVVVRATGRDGAAVDVAGPAALMVEPGHFRVGESGVGVVAEPAPVRG